MTASVCECPLCRATFQVTPEMAGTAVQCPACARPLQLPARINAGASQVFQATRIDVCSCPQCGQGFGFTTQMLGTIVACPHCSSSFRLSTTGQLEKEKDGKVIAAGNPTQPPEPAPPPLPARDKDRNPDWRPASPSPGKAGHRLTGSTSPPGDPSPAPPLVRLDKPRPAKVPGELGEIRIELPKPAAPGEKPTRPTSPAIVEKTGTPGGKPVKPPLPVPGSKEKSDSPATRPGKPPTDLLLPPGFAGNGTDSAAVPPLIPADAARLLPPNFYSSDPTIIRQRKNRSESVFVLLPDAAGGFQRVNNTLIRIQHQGETVILAAPDPAKVRRRRLVVNLLTLVVCLAILYLTFLWLSN